MEIKDVLFLIINFGILIATIIMAAKQTDYLVHLAFYRQNEKGPDPVESSRFFKFLPIETRLTLLNIYVSLLVIVYHIRRQKPTLRCGFFVIFLIENVLSSPQQNVQKSKLVECQILCSNLCRRVQQDGRGHVRKQRGQNL